VAFDLLPALAILSVICVAIYAVARKETELSKRLRTMIADDLTILIIGAYGLAAINFVLTLLVTHVRSNQYEDRYLIPTTLFGPISAILILFLVFRESLNVFGAGRHAKQAFLTISLALLWLAFPRPAYHRDFESFHTTALVLTQQAPRAVLLGDYWGTYVVAALQTDDAITPVPLREFENRMPWTRDIVHKVDLLLVEYRRSGLEVAGQPPPQFSAYGNSFRLTQPNVFQHGDFAFAWYVRNP
jgi:hypothetical protein